MECWTFNILFFLLASPEITICTDILLYLQKRKTAWSDVDQNTGVSGIVTLKSPFTDDKAPVSPMRISQAYCMNKVDMSETNAANSEAELFKEDKKVSGLLFVKKLLC